MRSAPNRDNEAMVRFRFPPKENFQPFEFRFSKEDPYYAFVGPSAAAVGWIPFYSSPSQLPEGDLRQRWARDPSLARVF